MYKVMVAGAGKIGCLIACLLAKSGDYEVYLIDNEFKGADVSRLLAVMPTIRHHTLDIRDVASVIDFIQQFKINVLISSLPYFLNPHLAKAARQTQAHYFDLTEDVRVTAEIKKIAEDAKSAFVPQCGVAPGFIGIVTHNYISSFDECYRAKLRVGALPQHSSNALHYSLTWSTDGLINEYGNPCYGIEEGQLKTLSPLEGLEQIQLEGCLFEAFNTSGGLGHLAESLVGHLQTLNYKTLRYPGHCEKIAFLMQGLNLNQDRATLKQILEQALPKTYQDMVIMYVSVEGKILGENIEKSYYHKVYPKVINTIQWSAIQLATASGICAVVDLTLSSKTALLGFVSQEKFDLQAVLNNRFGQCFATQ